MSDNRYSEIMAGYAAKHPYQYSDVPIKAKMLPDATGFTFKLKKLNGKMSKVTATYGTWRYLFFENNYKFEFA